MVYVKMVNDRSWECFLVVLLFERNNFIPKEESVYRLQWPDVHLAELTFCFPGL